MKGHLPQSGEGVQPDHPLIALVGGGPDPAPGVVKPFGEVVAERGVMVRLKDRGLDHRRATVALVTGSSKESNGVATVFPTACPGPEDAAG